MGEAAWRAKFAADYHKPSDEWSADWDLTSAVENLTLLYDLARPPKQQWLGPGPHSNILTTDFYEYTKRVIGFLDATRPK